MIAENPDTIMEIIEDFCTSKEEDEELKIDIDSETYKAKIESAKNNLKIVVKIFRIRDEDLFSIDFTRKEGDLIEFLTLFKEIEEHINKKFGYTDEDEDQQN